MKYRLICGLFLLFAFLEVGAQTVLRWDSVRVWEGNVLLRNAGAGGLESPIFSEIDLDGDGLQDLMAFDVAARKVVAFHNGGTANQIDYDFAGSFQDAFPDGAVTFVIAADYDCDGKADLFCRDDYKVAVYHNISTPGHLSFQLYRDTLQSMVGSAYATVTANLAVIPAIVDVDGDGDLDYLTFDANGSAMEWHKNMAIENSGQCAGLDLVLVEHCWGHVGFGQDSIQFGLSCRNMDPDLHIALPPSPPTIAPTSLFAFDEDLDGDLEILVGNDSDGHLLRLQNGGNAAAANFVAGDYQYPSYNQPADLLTRARGFVGDVDNDGKADLLTTSHTPKFGLSTGNIAYYHNAAPGNGHQFDLQNDNFLTDQMLDVGYGSHPVLFDYNSDGLLDLVVSNEYQQLSAGPGNSSMVVYENTGTANAPAFTRVPGMWTQQSTTIGALSPAFGDLDGDGDLDLLLGGIDGKLQYLPNIAATGQAAVFGAAVTQYMGIDVGQFSTVAIVDVDRDGKLDLVVGEMDGKLNYFHNIGTAQSAAFNASPDDAYWGGIDLELLCCEGNSAPFIFTNPITGKYDLIIGSRAGELWYYHDFESELGGAFTRDQAAFGGIDEGQGSCIAGADLNQDGVWEWIVGNRRGGLGFYNGNAFVVAQADPKPAPALNWEVFPNPSHGKVTVRLGDGAVGKVTVRLLDLQGRSLIATAESPAALDTVLDLQDLSAGVYVLRVELNGMYLGVKRIVVSL